MLNTAKSSCPKIVARKWLNLQRRADEFQSDYAISRDQTQRRKSSSHVFIPEEDFSEKSLDALANIVLPIIAFHMKYNAEPEAVDQLFDQKTFDPGGNSLGRDSETVGAVSMGHSCEKFADWQSQYMTYRVLGPCLDACSLGQKVILQGCESLPRRRCLPKSVPKIGGG
ncbi:putative ATRAD3 [Tripterygium wilfordii]|uniref:Putative ATRAD3 n=1 Tax=Tripterygium wilfordii TaxID=458696 RepID=A0A7J7DX57_TRIWF|nr:putative ATRAD3 [Tripterygium wilfordii]